MVAKRVAVLCLTAVSVAALAGCGGGGGGSITPPPVVTETLTVTSVNPASGVTVQVSPADTHGTTSGPTSLTLTYNQGTVVSLTAAATTGGNNFVSWSGCSHASGTNCGVTLNASATVTASYVTPVTPTVTVTPASLSLTTVNPLTVAVALGVPAGTATPTGSVVVSGGGFTSAATVLSAGAASVAVPAGSLAVGNDVLTAVYTPDTASAAAFNGASGSSAAIAVTAAPPTVVTVGAATGVTVTDQILGMNMAAWYDPTTSGVVSAFQAAGIKAVRWPGGSWSDNYHWANNTLCGGTPNGNATFAQFVNSLAVPAGLDIALTADYGTDIACTGPGDPTEAAAWAAEAVKLGANVSHMTVGNEEYGSWETDLHTKKNDAATYASAVSTGYYPDIKAAAPAMLVGVVVNPGNVPAWDSVVLANAPYDFVELHSYPQGPFSESDTYLVTKAAQDLTATISALKAELAAAGKAGTPIYLGEMGTVYSNPGKQSMSITQGLYAGQALGEMMNDGIARATWWIGFGNCNGKSGNLSSSLYGWQQFGAYNVFADGPSDTGCAGAGSLGTMSPTARAFQLFSQVAVTGESVLAAGVSGDSGDIRAYAATHAGGTAVVLFNLNATVAQPVTIAVAGKANSSGVTVTTYSKALYDQTNAATPVWAAPTTATLGAQSLPVALTLAPWSINVVIVQ